MLKKFVCLCAFSSLILTSAFAHEEPVKNDKKNPEDIKKKEEVLGCGECGKLAHKEETKKENKDEVQDEAKKKGNNPALLAVCPGGKCGQKPAAPAPKEDANKQEIDKEVEKSVSHPSLV